jgi:lipoprotein-releasing system permease protein
MYKFLLCSRYLRTRYIALASIISVMLGVATMIVVNSVMSGFSTQMRERLHGILADIVLEAKSLDGVPDANWHLARIREVAGEHIAAMSPTVEVYGMLSFQYAGGEYITRPVTLIGIEPESKAQVGTLKEHLTNYQATLDDDGNVVEPAKRSMDQVPDWVLNKDEQSARLIRARQRQLFGRSLIQGPRAVESYDPMPTPDEGGAIPESEAAADPTSPATFVNPFDDDAARTSSKSEDEQLADMAAPLAARVYVGIGLVSYPYQNRRTGKVETAMMVQPGYDVQLSTVTKGRPPSPAHVSATVVDIFKSGMSEYDSNLVFINLEELQRIRGMIFREVPDDPGTEVRDITAVHIRLKDYADAATVIERLREAFPPNLYSVHTWEEKQGPLLEAVRVESAILNVLLFLIIAVAGFGILAIFFMIVVEKTRDIGILKALGASSNGVLTIFLSYGLGLGFVGSGIGVLLGLVFVWQINRIEKFLTWITGQKVFDERIYYFKEIPTDIQPLMVVWVACGAIAIAVLASILPARRAAALHPVRALRYE